MFSISRRFCFCRSFSSAVKPARLSHLGTLNESDIGALRGIVGDTNVLVGTDDTSGYTTDWTGAWSGVGSAVVRPRTTAEVSAVMKHAHERRLAVVPQGGNTGLVGGGVPVHDEIVLSMARMNDIEDFDHDSGVVTCQAGVILEMLDQYAAERGYMVPIDLGAKGSCHIGGNLATNAGGIRLLRYGSLRGNVLGVEAVLADGTVVDAMSTLRKDNTGYDLKNLFIGSEGTLGIITRLALLTPRRPAQTNVVLMSVASFADVVALLGVARQHAAEVLSAFEFVDPVAMRLVRDNLPVVWPLEEAAGSDTHFYVVLETHGSNAAHDEEKVNAVLTSAMESGLALDGCVAASDTQQHQLWALREQAAEAMKHAGCVYKYDVSLPLSAFYRLVEEVRERLHAAGLADQCHVAAYGHIGDGNLHINVVTPAYDDTFGQVFVPFIYEFCKAHGGSISAEHGLGFMKTNYVHYSKAPEAVHVMQQIMSVLDPHNLLNPYKVLPQT